MTFDDFGKKSTCLEFFPTATFSTYELSLIHWSKTGTGAITPAHSIETSILGRDQRSSSRWEKHVGRRICQGQTTALFVWSSPAPGMTQQKQRDEFAEQLLLQLGMPTVQFPTWSSAFRFLGSQLKQTEIIVLFDEISWMGGLDPVFLGSLKTWWDQYGSKQQRLILILCGSISTWIKKIFFVVRHLWVVSRWLFISGHYPFKNRCFFLRKRDFLGPFMRY